MEFHLTSCIALQVEDIDGAALYYEQKLGFKRGRVAPHWIEILAGEMSLFLCRSQEMPFTLELVCGNAAQGLEYLKQQGFEQVQNENDPDLYVRDRFGVHYALSDSLLPPNLAD